MSAEKKSTRKQELHNDKYFGFGKHKGPSGKYVESTKAHYLKEKKFLEVKPVEDGDKRGKLSEGGIRQTLVKQYNAGNDLYLYHLTERLAGLPEDVSGWLDKDVDVKSDNVIYFDRNDFKSAEDLSSAIKERLAQLDMVKAPAERKKVHVDDEFKKIVQDGVLAEHVADLVKEMKEAHSAARKEAAEEKKAAKSKKRATSKKSKAGSKKRATSSKAKSKGKAKSKSKAKSKAKAKSKSPTPRSPSEVSSRSAESKSPREEVKSARVSESPEEPVVSKRVVRGRRQ